MLGVSVFEVQLRGYGYIVWMVDRRVPRSTVPEIAVRDIRMGGFKTTKTRISTA